MKKLVVMIALVVGATTFAQEKRMERKAMDTDKKVEKLTKELDLSPEQQEKIKVLFEKKNDKERTARAERKATPTQAATLKKASLKQTANPEFDREIRTILTPEQVKKWEARKTERKKHRVSDKIRE